MSSISFRFPLPATMLVVLALFLSGCTGDGPDGDTADTQATDAASSSEEVSDQTSTATETEAPTDDATTDEVPVEDLEPAQVLEGQLTIAQPDGSDPQVVEGVTVCTFVPSIFMLNATDATMQVSYLTVDYGSRGIDGRLSLDGVEYRVPDYQATSHGLTDDGQAVTGTSLVVSPDGTELLATWTLDASEAPPCTGVEALDTNPGEGLDVGEVDTSDLGFVMLNDRRLDVVGGCGLSNGDESTFELELEDTAAGAPAEAVFTHLYVSGQTGMTITDGSGTTYTGNTPEGGPAVMDPGLEFSGAGFIFAESGQAATIDIQLNIAALEAC